MPGSLPWLLCPGTNFPQVGTSRGSPPRGHLRPGLCLRKPLTYTQPPREALPLLPLQCPPAETCQSCVLPSRRSGRRASPDGTLAFL